MVSLIIYSIKSAFCLTLLYLPFSLFLRNETRHRMNRIVLISILAASFIIPSIRIAWGNPSAMNISANSARLEVITSGYLDQALSREPIMSQEDGISNTQTHIEYENTITTNIQNTNTHIAASSERHDNKSLWPTILLIMYATGTFSIFILRTVQIISLYLYIHRNCVWKRKLNNTTIYCHKGDIPPFSWMKSIVIGETDAARPSYNAVIAHERAHVACRHSVDIIIITFAEILQWFNPVLWMLRHDLCAIHEYEADEYVLRQGTDMKTYQLLLVSRLAKPHFLNVANGFSHTSLKSRIIMMLRDKSKRWTICKYFYIIPASAFALIAFASPKIEEVANKMDESRKEIIEKIKDNIDIPVFRTDSTANKNTEDIDLDKLKSVKTIRTIDTGKGRPAEEAQKMTLRGGYIVTFTSKQNEASTDYYLTVIDKKGKLTDRKKLGIDDSKTVFGIESRLCDEADTLLTFDISEARDVDNWEFNKHNNAWSNSWLIEAKECHIDKNGKIHTGKSYMTSISVNNYTANEKKQSAWPARFRSMASIYKSMAGDKRYSIVTDEKRGIANLLSQELRNEKVYTHADKLPVYNGSERELQERIGNILRADNRTIVRFIVRSDGTVTDVHSIGTLTAEQNKRVEDMFYTMSKWQPAQINGKAVSMIMTMPLNWMNNKKAITTPERMLYNLYSSCISGLTPHGIKIENSSINKYFTDNMMSRMGDNIEKALLGDSEIDHWAERTLKIQPLEMNWYIVEYAKALFTPEAEYKHIAVHLSISGGRYVVDNINTSPSDDPNIRKYMSGLIFNSDDMKQYELPSFKTMADGTENTVMRNIKGLGDRMAMITFMVYADGNIDKINIIDIADRNSEPIENEVKQRMKEKLRNIKWEAGTAYGMKTNYRMSMIATNTNAFLIK